jgi:cell shape-determining protein MreC
MMHQFLDKKQITKKKKITRNVIGFGVFFILSVLGVLGWTGHLFNFIGRPIWEAKQSIISGVNNIGYFFNTKASLSNENERLLRENSDNQLRMIDYQILKDENNELKSMLGRLPVSNDLVLGNILTKPNNSPYDTIIIDAGQKEGLKDGNQVFANGDIPIGNVAKVYDKTSLVTLYTNPGQKTEGFINGLNASVELIGRGGGNFEMIVPVELQIERGTIIYLPGSTSLDIALIDETISTPTDPFKKVLLSSPVNVQNLKWVEVKKD